jgi:hypothetical protein
LSYNSKLLHLNNNKNTGVNMFNLKKTALAVLAFSSTFAYAGSMGPVCSAVNVTVPCENTAWDLGGRALYLQATGGFAPDVNWANGVSLFDNLQSDTNWGWGFQLEASYHYSTGNDMNVNWWRLHPGTTTHTLGQDTLIYDYNPTQDRIYYADSYVSNTPAWDQVNIEFAQHIDFGEHKFARIHGGMNWSRVAYSSAYYRHYQFNDQNHYTNGYYTSSTRVYNGFGPRVGMDLNYEWGNGFGVYGKGALSVLAGTSKFSTNYTFLNSTDPDTVIGLGHVAAASNPRVIGELDSKLGLMYNVMLAQGDLSLDVGWAFAQYIGFGVGSAGKNTPTGAAGTTENHANFGIQGLYFGMKWIGNLA